VHPSGRDIPLDVVKTYSNPCLPKLIYVMPYDGGDGRERTPRLARQGGRPFAVR
jgi:hypothetical protein